MDNNLAPIVLFVYNRPWHTKQTIEALQRNSLANKSELYIYSDYAKNEDARKSVDEVRSYIKSINGFRKITLIEREKNWGLANSIIDGVTTIVNKYEKIIVLEDDLVTSPYFLKFMNDGLLVYKDNLDVWEVGGYVYPIKNENERDFIFTPYTTSWGWATWKTRWIHFKRLPNELINKFTKEDIIKFNLDNSDNIWSQVLENENEKIYTWAVFWYAVVFLNKGLTLYPVQSIVQNIGHDGSGDNCGNSNAFHISLSNKQFDITKIKPQIDEDAFNKVKKYLKNNKSYSRRIYRKLKSFLK